MDGLNDYLKNMNFKRRTMGGLDEEDVLTHIKKIRDLAQQEIDKRDAQIQSLTNQLIEANAQLDRWQRSCQATKESNSQLESRIREFEEEPERYRKAREQAEQAERHYDTKLRELLSVMKTLENLQSDVELKVRQEVRESLRNEEERARTAMLARIEEERKSANAEISRLSDEIASLREQRQGLSESLRARREQLNRYLGWIDQQLDFDSGELDSSPIADVDAYAYRGSHARYTSDII